jgi:O-succinylbenzoate synthase
MKIDQIELALLKLPYVHFFETSFGREYDRTFVITKVYAGGICGYGEVVASSAPLYSGETTGTAWHILKDFLIPLVFEKSLSGPEEFYHAAGKFRENPMAKAGLELSLWDLKAKTEGLPLWKLYGGVTQEIPAGVSCGIEDSIADLLDRVKGYLDEGYQRVKIKIKPGWDVEVCEAVRKKFPGILLQVDANGAYKISDIDHLKKLDAYDLLMIEQPFAPHDLWDHSRLQKQIKTPLCLDESILTEDSARKAHEMGSCRIVNIKVGRVGGIVEARKIHDFCQAHGMPVWCGGMLESGIGRAHNLHLASLSNFIFPNDLSASNRYYKQDLVDPEIELSSGGVINVPQAPGIGVFPVEERIRKATVQKDVFRAG